MAWVDISVNGTTNLYINENGILTALRYCNAIHDQFVLPCAGAIAPEFILMDDHALAHCAHVSNAYLDNRSYGLACSIDRSRDLNPTEQAWDILQHAISARPVQPRTLQELNDALVAEWRLIPQNRMSSYEHG